MDICRTCSSALDVDAGPAPARVSFQVHMRRAACSEDFQALTNPTLVAEDGLLLLVYRQKCVEARLTFLSDEFLRCVLRFSLIPLFRTLRPSMQRVFLPLVDLATSTGFKNSPLRKEVRDERMELDMGIHTQCCYSFAAQSRSLMKAS